ncbi:hypothetical protein LTR94_025315, partial [Friedmanniomyces endolithicus]
MSYYYGPLGALLATTAVAGLCAPASPALALVQVQSSRLESRPDQVEDVVVTGTNLRGRAPIATVEVIERDEIELFGFTNSGEVLRSLPQAFAGSMTNEGSWASGENAGQNSVGQGSANLFGLGDGATLVLLNGQRLPLFGGGITSDVSLVPSAAIERMEVLSDGASAIYGADAVAGVVNIITRTDFEGLELRSGYGAARGGYETTTADLLAGTTLRGVSLMAGVNYFDRTELWNREREQSRNANLALDRPYTLLTGLEQTSYFGSASTDLSATTRLSFNAMHQVREGGPRSAQGATSIASTTPESDQTYLAGAVEIDLPRTWLGEFNMVRAFNETRSTSTSTPVAGGPSRQTNASRTNNELTSIDLRASGGLWQAPAGQVRLALGVSYRDEASQRRSLTRVNPDVNQTVWGQYLEVDLPVIGPNQGVRFADELRFSAALRRDDYSDFGSRISPRLAASWRPHRDLTITGSYSESFRPPTPYHLNLGYFIYGVSVLDNVPGGRSNSIYVSGSG